MMRAASTFSCLVLPCSSPAPRPRAPPPPATSTAVLVFADRARVTRARTVACEKGTARAVFERLPAALDVRTLRGEVREAAEVIGLSGEQVNEREAADPRARALAADLDKIDNDIKANQARRTAIVAELEHVGAFGNVFSATLTEEIRNPKPNTAVWANTLDALRARRAALADERRKLDVALRGLQQTADKLRRQLAQVGGAGERAYRTAAVTVELPRAAAGDGDRLVRRRRRELAARVRRRRRAARPRQDRTGDRAPDGRRADPPGDRRGLDQRARHAVDRAPEAGLRGAAAGAAGRRRLRAGSARRCWSSRRSGASSWPRAAAAARRPGRRPRRWTTRATRSCSPCPTRSPSSRTAVRCGRRSTSSRRQATVKLVATPKLDEHVYQVAALKNPAAYPLLEGRVRSYRNGSYVGDSRLRHQGVGAPFEISLGVDEELKVERKTREDKDKSAGFLSSTKHIVQRLSHQADQSRRRPRDDRTAREHPRHQDRRREGGGAARA